MADDELYRVLRRRLTDPETLKMLKRALVQGVVLDTWMNGEEEERVGERAIATLAAAAGDLTRKALATGAIMPSYRMPEGYVRSVFTELLFSMALYVAQEQKGRREVSLTEAEEAVARLSSFVVSEPEELAAAGIFFITINTYEDLNAIGYYGRMNKEDFLQGRLHRPWSNLVLSAQLDMYRRMGLVDELFAGEGDLLSLTERGEDALEALRRILQESGELKWRSHNQRWVIFSEMDFDQIYSRVFPDIDRVTADYLKSLGLGPGMKVLEVGAGTGRATLDLGLCDLLGAAGEVVALEPAAALRHKLEDKCRERGIKNVKVVRGVGEELPFPDGTFDATVAVYCLHFTDARRVVAEMARVTKPGGLVSAVNPPPEGDLREIPTVALWFRPLGDMAERFGLPFSEQNGLPVGLLESSFRRELTEVRVEETPLTISAADERSFLTFFMRGTAIFQNILCRLPYTERWRIMRRLEEEGAVLAAAAAPEEKCHVFPGEAAYGRVPA